MQHDHRNQPIDEFGQPLNQDSGDSPRRARLRNFARPLGQPGREQAQNAWGEEAADFFPQLAAHWKKNYAGWTAHVLTPDLKLPGKMRLKESRRVPMWNGPIECRLFRFDMVAGSARASGQRRGRRLAGRFATQTVSARLQPAEALPAREPVVIDTNIVLDILVFADAAAAPLRQALEDGKFHWLATQAMRDELERVLASSADRDAPGVSPAHRGGGSRRPLTRQFACRDAPRQIGPDLPRRGTTRSSSTLRSLTRPCC